MLRRITLVLLLVGYVIGASADPLTDSTAKLRFQKLADKMRLKTPKLTEGEYQIRIWNQQGLRYGDAQMLYLLTKTKRKFLVSKYIIDSDNRGFRYAVKLNPNPKISIDTSLWEKFVQQGIIDLPDMSAIHDKLYPKPPKDSTWTVVETDGSVTIKARKNNTNWIIISDGEGYYFEVIGANNYRGYSYSNPYEYLENKPHIVELQKVVNILNNLAGLFRSSN